MKILSIDAWATGDSGWEWNCWYHIGDISKEDFEALDTDQKILSFFYDKGYTNTDSPVIIAVEDDEHNIVIKDAETGEPVYAIEYGPEY